MSWVLRERLFDRDDEQFQEWFFYQLTFAVKIQLGNGNLYFTEQVCKYAYCRGVFRIQSNILDEENTPS